MQNMQHFRGVAAAIKRLPVSNETQQWDGGYHVTATGLRIEHCEPARVRQLKPGRTVSEGGYTRLTLVERRHELIMFRANPDVIYRNDPVGSKPPVAILQKNDGAWFPIVPLTDSEMSSLRAFDGTQGLDIDAARKRSIIKRQGKSSQNRGKSSHDKKAAAMNRTNKTLMSSVQYR